MTTPKLEIKDVDKIFRTKSGDTTALQKHPLPLMMVNLSRFLVPPVVVNQRY